MPSTAKTSQAANCADSICLGELPSMVGYHLRRAHAAALRDLDQKLARMQLTTAMHGALEILSHNPTVAQGVLAQGLGLTRSSMVPLVDKLVERGLVERVRLPEDRRAVMIKLTPEGRKLRTKLRRMVQEHEAQLHAALQGCDIDQFTQALQRLITLA
ncbi:MarR family winged helix-turn-helix transcriptional regulator [Comamonas composti]|uniref:MarR family winged helix-turn-helix transcriptional regulator n=1 Tax=Comamonas composti TaxID=408558 RepID=UPI000684E30A|nr:MarR family transcriptional regulator [Comamonas composti]